jgi:hypothetical protein
MNISRWTPKHGLFKARTSSRYRKSSNRSFANSSSSNSASGASKVLKKPWAYAYAAVGGLLMGSFGWGWKTNAPPAHEEDEAKQTYLVRELSFPSLSAYFFIW